MQERHPTIVRFMEQAYARWQENRDWSREEFYDQLSPFERIAVYFGNMNYQVGNGGWEQWVYNGYYSPDVMSFIQHKVRYDLEQIPEVVELAGILKEIWGLLDEYKGIAEDRTYDVDPDEEEDLFNRLDPYASCYYRINEAVLDAVERHLTGLTTPSAVA